MKRGTLRRVGRRKRRLQRAGLADGPLCDMVRGRRCSVTGCSRSGEPHHVGPGGIRMDWLVLYDGLEAFGLQGAVVPLCHAHHMELHNNGVRTFEYEYGLDLEAEAVAWGETFRVCYPDRYRRILDGV